MVGNRPACGPPATRCAGQTSPDCWHPRGQDAPHILRPILHKQLPALAPTCVMSTQIAAGHPGPAPRCGPDRIGNNPGRHLNCPPGSGTRPTPGPACISRLMRRTTRYIAEMSMLPGESCGNALGHPSELRYVTIQQKSMVMFWPVYDHLHTGR
jgi:hypothetical protein